VASVLSPALEEAYAEWGRRVRAHREAPEQIGRALGREETWGPVASAFRGDPFRTDEAALDVLRGLVAPGDTWLDIGAGAGRYALPLALLAREVVAVEPAAGMRTVLAEEMARHGIANVRIVAAEWPCAEKLEADVTLIAHVGYGTEEIGPFLEAMEGAARRLCVAVMLERAPSAAADPYWLPVHGFARESLPALPEFLALQLARGRLCEVRMVPRHAAFERGPEDELAFLRRHLRVEAGSAEDGRLQSALADRALASPVRDRVVGVVTWAPGAGGP
jgi:hypothetical protein